MTDALVRPADRVRPTAAIAAPDSRPSIQHDLWLRSMTEPTVTDQTDLADVVDLLDDELVRSILVATSAEPLSANELSDRCDVSASTVYRRIDRLTTADLVRERTRPRRDGHHETVYVSALDRFELTVRDGDLDWTLERRGADPADELSRMWGEF